MVRGGKLLFLVLSDTGCLWFQGARIQKMLHGSTLADAAAIQAV